MLGRENPALNEGLAAMRDANELLKREAEALRAELEKTRREARKEAEGQ